MLNNNGKIDILWLLAAAVCASCTVGLLAEIRRFEWAGFINIGTPAALTVLMASTFIWKPAFTRGPYYTAEQTEGDAFIMVLSVIPLFLTILLSVAYWKFSVKADPPARIGMR